MGGQTISLLEQLPVEGKPPWLAAINHISIYIIENVGERASAHTPLKPGLTYGGGKDLMGEPMGEMIFKKIQKK